MAAHVISVLSVLSCPRSALSRGGHSCAAAVPPRPNPGGWGDAAAARPTCVTGSGKEPLLRRAPAASSPRRSPPVSAPPLQPMALSEVAACGGADPAPRAGRRGGGSSSAGRSLPSPAPRLRTLLPAAASSTPPAPTCPATPPLPAVWTPTPGSSAKASWSHPQVRGDAAGRTGAARLCEGRRWGRLQQGTGVPAPLHPGQPLRWALRRGRCRPAGCGTNGPARSPRCSGRAGRQHRRTEQPPRRRCER